MATVVIYAGWLAAAAWNADIPAPLLFLFSGGLLAWQGPLQHETIHAIRRG